ncbi:MAG: hypothetical protein JWQ35_1047, partial [Bacteriovoracaceae bacterium]|nr:hypothetical protein [Bacteriovoracaceae bacterium]
RSEVQEMPGTCVEALPKLIEPSTKKIRSDSFLAQRSDEKVAEDLIAFFKFHTKRNNGRFFPGSAINRSTKNSITEEEQILSRRLQIKNWSVANYRSSSENPEYWGKNIQLKQEQKQQLDYWMKDLQFQEAKIKQAWAFFLLDSEERDLIRKYRRWGIDRDFGSFRREWMVQDQKILADKISKIKIKPLRPGDEDLRSDLYDFFLKQESGETMDQIADRKGDFVNYFFPGGGILRPHNVPKSAAEKKLYLRLKTRGWIPENWEEWQYVFSSDPEHFQKMDEIMQILQLIKLDSTGTAGIPRFRKRLEIGIRRQLRENRDVRYPESQGVTSKYLMSDITRIQSQENALEISLRTKARISIRNLDHWLTTFPKDIQIALRWYFLFQKLPRSRLASLITNFYSTRLP